ncbi:MAG: hypothetical protein HDS24_04810 [Bacteroides sp.]|nr:hypothetical protein [Bacteroides sp.]
MKKTLLSFAAVALGVASMQATSYQLFNHENPGEWGSQGTGFAQTQKFDGASFSIVTDKASSSTDLVSPDAYKPYAWRVYKGSNFTVTSENVTMKSIQIEYDTFSDNKYVLELSVNDGWSGSIADAIYTLKSAGAKTFTGQSVAGQVRINSLVVSDEDTVSDNPLTPSSMTPEGSTTPSEPGDEISGYVIFDITNPGTWTKQGSGFTQTSAASGAEFTITTDLGTSTTELISPDTNTFAWRVYKGSNVTIESASVEMKTIQITYDDYNSGQYCKELVLSSGWTGSLNGALYTINGNGKTITLTAETSQVRIKKIVVSGEGGVTPPPASNLVYSNTFDSSISDWTVLNEIDNGLSGWRINTSTPKCAIANSYSNGTVYEASAWLMKEFDLTDRVNCSMTVEQAFGFTFPSSQPDYATVNIREAGDEEWEVLVMANFPETPSGNWSSWVSNEFDLSAYDGVKVEIGFHYYNDGNQSYAWELKNFVLNGDITNGVNEVAAANGETAFYTLQGVRVAQPSAGLYIMVKDGKATKVVVR